MKKILVYILVFGTGLVYHYCLVSYSWSAKSDDTSIQGIVVEAKEIIILEWWDSKDTIINYLKGSQYIFVHGHFKENQVKQIELYFQYVEFRKIHHTLESFRRDPDMDSKDTIINYLKVDKYGKIWDIDCVHIGVIGSYNICINWLETPIIKVALLQPKPLNKVITIKACRHPGRLISKNQIRGIVDGLQYEEDKPQPEKP